MFCPKCGKELPDGARFCTQCGAGLNTAEGARPQDSPVQHTEQEEKAGVDAVARLGIRQVLIALITAVAAFAIVLGVFGANLLQKKPDNTEHITNVTSHPSNEDEDVSIVNDEETEEAAADASPSLEDETAEVKTEAEAASSADPTEEPEPDSSGEEMETEEVPARDFTTDEIHELTWWMDSVFQAELAEREADVLMTEQIDIQPASSFAKASALYRYQYFSTADSRIRPDNETGEYHYATRDDLRAIMGELFPDANDADMEVFFSNFSEQIDENTVRMYATGDFGDVGICYLDAETASIIREGDHYSLTGDVVRYNQEFEDFVPVGKFTAWLRQGNNPWVANCCFEKLSYEQN